MFALFLVPLHGADQTDAMQSANHLINRIARNLMIAYNARM